MSKPIETIDQAVEGEAESLKELSGKIWSKPELAFEEKFAHDTLTEYLEGKGFLVERKFKLDTAFRATFSQGSGGPNVAVICEYDALPEIGHACGHNLIAESGVAAALGLKAALQASSSTPGTVTVLGTPAEEGGGGKLDLIDAGAFADVDVCMMVHPDATNMMAPVVLAVNHAVVTFTGKAAHAAAAPWEGVNALDAAVSAYTALSMLRQQLKTDCRIHAVISEGGTKPNIIPERSVLKFYIRARTDAEVGVLKEKLSNIMKAAALAAGCQVEIKYQSERPAFYSNLITSRELVDKFCKHWQSLGPATRTLAADRVWASTDMGNVSYVVPSIHPTFNIGTAANVHTRDFAAAAMTAEAHAATRCVAKAMAAVGWDILTDSALLKDVKESFKKQLAEALPA